MTKLFAGILATKRYTGGKQQKALPLCLPFAFETFILCEGPEKGTVMVISQIDGCGRSHLAYWKGVMLGDEDRDGNWSIPLPLRALSSLIMEKHCVVSLNAGWDTPLMMGAESVTLQYVTSAPHCPLETDSDASVMECHAK